METIEELTVYKEKNIILDSKIASILFFHDKEERLGIEIILDPYLRHFKSKEKINISFTFTNLIEYYVYFDNEYMSYVERYKFFKTNEDYFYLSLDPFDEHEKSPSDKDGFVICTKNIKRKIIEK